MKTTGKRTIALIIVVLIVGIVVSAVYLTRRQVTSAFSIASSTLVGVQGAADVARWVRNLERGSPITSEVAVRRLGK